MELGNVIFGNSRGSYKIPGGKWQDRFIEVMDSIGIDNFGYLECDQLGIYETDRGGFENEVFLVNPYYWGTEKETCEKPNFIFKPMGLTINWYKSPLRDAYSNIKLNYEQFENILKECQNSVKYIVD